MGTDVAALLPSVKEVKVVEDQKKVNELLDDHEWVLLDITTTAEDSWTNPSAGPATLARRPVTRFVLGRIV